MSTRIFTAVLVIIALLAQPAFGQSRSSAEPAPPSELLSRNLRGRGLAFDVDAGMPLERRVADQRAGVVMLATVAAMCLMASCLSPTGGLTHVSGATGLFLGLAFARPFARIDKTNALKPSAFAEQAASSSLVGALGVSLVGEVGMTHFGGDFGGNTTSFLGGPRFTKVVSDRIAPFGQVLAGVLHDTGFNDFALQPGGGVTIALPDKKFLVEGRLDFPIDIFEGGHQTATRFSAGIVFPLGQKK